MNVDTQAADTAGWRPALLAARATCRDKDVPLRLVTEAGSLVARIIQITTPDGAFDVRPTMVAALAHAA
jgi:hypothetical protein